MSISWILIPDLRLPINSCDKFARISELFEATELKGLQKHKCYSRIMETIYSAEELHIGTKMLLEEKTHNI